MVHRVFPDIDLVQLEPGPLCGWVFFEKVGPFRVSIGSFDRSLLYDGRYNSGMLNLCFIFSEGHTGMSQAHEYGNGVISLNLGASYMHEIFPAHMIWLNIAAPEAVLMKGITYSKKELQANPHLLLEGSRAEVAPLIDFINEHFLKSAHQEPNGNDSILQARLQSLLFELLSSRFTENIYENPFVTGNKFRMHMLSKIEKLFSTSNDSLSLDEICIAAQMKPRTVQQYFREIYGMGPTKYFRARRLNCAREDLMHHATSVSAVALRWQFTHFGRFSLHYKKLFDESPSDTIKLRITP